MRVSISADVVGSPLRVSRDGGAFKTNCKTFYKTRLFDGGLLALSPIIKRRDVFYQIRLALPTFPYNKPMSTLSTPPAKLHLLEVWPGAARLSFKQPLEDFERRPPPQIRKPITTFSPSSYRRFCLRISGLAVLPFLGSCLTLTASSDTPINAAVFRDFKKRLSGLGIKLHIWKFEFQRSGNPHLHMLVKEQEAEYIRDLWILYADKHGHYVNPIAQHITPIYDYKGYARYVSKHLSKSWRHYQNKPPPNWDGGRIWGISQDLMQQLELSIVSVELNDKEAWQYRRILRRLRRLTSKNRRFAGCSVFWVDGADIIRALKCVLE